MSKAIIGYARCSIDKQDLAAEFGEALRFIPNILLAPVSAVLMANGIRKIASQSDEQPPADPPVAPMRFLSIFHPPAFERTNCKA